MTCASCDTSHWHDSKPCAGALVNSRDELLLVRRANPPWIGCWDVPGGFCGPREHPREAAAREVREETGLVVHVGPILGIWMDDSPAGADSTKVTMNVYYHASVDGRPDPLIDPAEVADLSWFPPDALPGDLAFPGHVPDVLRAWCRSLRRNGRRVAPRRLRERA